LTVVLAGLSDPIESPRFATRSARRLPNDSGVWCLNTWAIIFAALGAGSELFGLGMVVREIKGDRDRARSLLDKHQSPRQVSASAINLRPTGLGSLQVGGSDRHLASMFASLVSGHNQSVHDMGGALDKRTAALLDEIDNGDKELRGFCASCWERAPESE